MADFSIGTGKLQHIYDLHAEDFGLLEKKTPERLQHLYDATESHLSDSDTKLVQGHYRGQIANLWFNLRTQNVVVTNGNTEVIAGFKASPAQAAYITSTGRLN